jgi:hypothetical protein
MPGNRADREEGETEIERELGRERDNESGDLISQAQSLAFQTLDIYSTDIQTKMFNMK